MPWLLSAATAEHPSLNATSANTTVIPDFDPPRPFLGNGTPIPARAFTSDFETGDLSQWTSVEGAKDDSIQVVTQPVRAGRYAARFRLRPGELVHHGNRAEITHNLLDPPGSVGWYAWSIFIPEEGYPDDPNPDDWQILCQFHDQPNADLGWGWDNFPPHNSSIALYYVSHPVRAIGLGFGLNLPKGQMIHAPVPIKKDEWLDILFHVGWSTGDDGYAEAWVNGHSLTGAEPVKGRTMYYAYTDYLKLGIYRDPNSTSTVELYLDEFRAGPTREAVQLPDRTKRKLRLSK